MKKVFIKIFTISLIFTYLSGCSSNKNVEDSAVEKETVEENVSDENSNDEEIVVEEKATNEFKWLSYDIVVEEIRESNENDTYLKSYTIPEGQRFIIVKILGKDNTMIKYEDINFDNISSLVLIDENENEINASMFSVWGVTIDVNTNEFSTKEEQEGFDLVYVVDDNIELESLNFITK